MKPKIKTRYAQYSLSAASIDQIAEEIEAFLYNMDTERANVLRIRLALEEALLRWQDHFGEAAQVTFVTGTRWRRPVISLELKGESFDPILNSDGDLGNWSDNLLSGIGLTPRYVYQRGVNILQVRLPRPHWNPALNLLIALGLGLFLGFGGGAVFPQSIQSTLIQTTLDPIQSVFFRILNSASGPIIFFTVLVAICGIGNLAAGGKTGRKMLLQFLVLSMGVAIISLIISVIVFSVHYYDYSSQSTRFSNVLNLFLSFIPNDILSPFISGDSPQLILVAFIIGNAILVAGTQTEGVTKLLEQLNAVGLIVADWVSRLSPFFIVVLLVLGLWNRSLQSVLGCWKPLLLFLVLTALTLVSWMLLISWKYKIPFRKLTKKLRPSFLVSLRTASVDAAYGDIQFCCEKRLGLPRSLTSYGLPFGLVLYMPANTMATMIFTLYAAKSFGVVISGVWCLTALVLTVSLIMASPPMAGVNLLAYAAIFSRLGIPSDALTIVLIADTLYGFVTAAANQTLLQLNLILQAEKNDQLDITVLRK